MSPPSAPGIPGTKLPPARRPMPSNPPPREQRPKLDSVEIAAGTLVDELAAKSAENAELAARLAAYERPSRWQWHRLLYKLGGALVAILVPCGAYLAYRVEMLAPRVDNAKASVTAVEKKTETGRDLQLETLVFLAAWQRYQDCINGQQASATVRGTGHKLRSLPETETLWFEQNKPPNRPAPLWASWSWATVNDCGAEPHVPTLNP